MALEGVAGTLGDGTFTAASDTVGGLSYQIIKVALGADGTATLITAGSSADAASLPVTQSTEDKAVLAALSAKLPASIGSKADAASLAVTQSTEDKAVLAALAASAAVMDDWDESDRAKINLIVGQAGITAGAGAVAANTPRITLASDDPLLAAVTASIGYNASVSVTRTADTNAYTANDVLGSATGSTAGIEFTSMGPSGGRIVITSVSFERDTTALISGETSYILHLYNVTPPSALGDNVAFDLPSGDRTAYLGSINLGTPVDLGSTLYIAQDGINKQIKLSGTSVFAYLVTVGAYTPTSGAVHVIKMNAVSL